MAWFYICFGLHMSRYVYPYEFYNGLVLMGEFCTRSLVGYRPQHCATRFYTLSSSKGKQELEPRYDIRDNRKACRKEEREREVLKDSESCGAQALGVLLVALLLAAC
jgi:hypothetical protein